MVATCVAAVATGCTSQQSSPASSPTALDGGWGATPVLRGTPPAWLNKPGSPVGMPYVLADPPQAAGFLFAQPLRVGHPQNPSNKILWEVNELPYGPSLDLNGHPVGSATPAINDSFGFLASGDVPSTVDVPQAGCWHFDLTWSGHRASVDLLYQ